MKVSSIRNLKRMMAVLCAVALVVTSFGGFGSVYANTKPAKKPAVAVNYQEVPEKYRAAMQRAVEMGLITPDAKGNVRPNDVMTLAEYCTVQWRLHHSWYGKTEADNGYYSDGVVTINGKDAKKHWAYIPVRSMIDVHSLGYLMKETKHPGGKDWKHRDPFHPKKRILDVEANKSVTEVMVYLAEAYTFASWSKYDDFINSLGTKSDKKNVLSKTSDVNNLLNYVPSKYGDTNFDEWSILGAIEDVFQITGLLALAGERDTVPIQPARRLTRAEVVYNIIAIDTCGKVNGFKMKSAKEQKDFFWQRVEAYKER